jgi:outer membrane receptor for ferrienterochelin and colicins
MRIQTGRMAGGAFVILAILGWAICCCAQTVPSSPAADLSQMSVEDLMKINVDTVYSASRHLQKVTEAAASVTIVTSEEIRTYGYRTLADVLRGVPGFYVTYDRDNAYAAVRGFGRTGDYNWRILLLVDGHRMNDAIYGLNFLDTSFPIDMDLIERVEVIHGPSASVYGDNAFFAVINVITKSGGQIDGLQVSAGGASYNSAYGRGTYGRKSKNWEALLSTTYYDTHGPSKLYFPEFNTPQTNNGIAQDEAGAKDRQVFAKLSYKDVRLEVAYGLENKGVPTASYGVVFNDHEEVTNRVGYGDLGYEHRFLKDLDVSSHLSFSSYTYDAFYPYNYSPQTGNQITMNHDYLNGAWWGEELKVAKHIFKKHLVTVGGEFRNNLRQTQANWDVSPFTLYLNSHPPTSTVYAFYGQDEWSLRKNMLLNIGLRHDQDGSYNGVTSPRVGIIYDPLAHTTVKLLYGSAFRAPSAYETYYSGVSIVSNNVLRPETIHTVELVVEQYIGSQYRLSGSVFHNNIDSLIGLVTLPGGGLQYQNQASARAKGTELLVERKWKSGLSAQINYTYEKSTDATTGVDLKSAPANMANALIQAPLFSNKLTVGMDLHYIGHVSTLAGKETSAFVLPNLTISSRPWRRLEVSGSLYNLFDSKYGYPGRPEHRQDIIYQDGRNMRLKLSYTFGGSK